MKPQVRVFTRESPCTKADLWACFSTATGGVKSVQVDAAHGVIGVNAPRVMIRNGYLTRGVMRRRPGVEVYTLTATGEAWLRAGVAAWIRNHPDRAHEVVNWTGE